MRIAVITGASTGIGRAAALLFARRGFRVIATMRDPERGDELVRLAAGEQLALAVVALDVTSDASTSEAFAKIGAEHGAVDVLVNNAGIAPLGTLEDSSVAVWREVLETNVLGAVRCCQAVLPSMRERRGGHIVNVSSVTGRMASPGQVAYSASKFALEAASEALALEVAPFGIRVSLVEPGVTATPIIGKAARAPSPTAYPHTYARLSALYRALLQRPATPEQIAEVIFTAATTGEPRLRWPAGPGAAELIAARAALADDAYVAMGGAEPEEYRRAFAERLGVELPPIGRKEEPK